VANGDTAIEKHLRDGSKSQKWKSKDPEKKRKNANA
jgi:hypothetical protein